MDKQERQHQLTSDLAAFTTRPFKPAALGLLETLGYSSDATLDVSGVSAFVEMFDRENLLSHKDAHLAEWEAVEFLFQLTDRDVQTGGQLRLFESSSQPYNDSIIESFLFVAIKLSGESYSRTKLAQITRVVNKLFGMPVVVIFWHGETLTFSVIHRRLHKRDVTRDVLEKVTLIKDIRLHQPHRAHLEILHDLSLAALHAQHDFHNFVGLHKAWMTTLDSSELNKKFFREIANWYFWAIQHVTFPDGSGEDEQTRNAISTIRLVTRLIFVWFLKEKGLVPDALFRRDQLADVLTWEDARDSTYYKAILQNLFFASLNQEMGDKRAFRRQGKGKARDGNYMAHNVYRYERYFRDAAAGLALFAEIPFLNGGLFECLDRLDANGKAVRIDGFSDRDDNPLVVPDWLFFGEEATVDLSSAYGTTKRGKEKVRGLIHIFNRYKFTVDENTPIEEEIALDPELLGKVFENLLAAYNPETETTARKQTGSFYTPREIVNFMVDESLLLYLQRRTRADEGDLRHLLAYNAEPPRFDEGMTVRLISVIDEMKILDPACGSGAYPMGVLLKLVFLLKKLDPHNERWKQQQIERAWTITDPTIQESTISEIELNFERNELDYGRKLYLIENCIFGVDIQPIAVLIAKLRFFISLIVNQNVNEGAENRGVRPLPNLETKLVAADTLSRVELPQRTLFADPRIERIKAELASVRQRYFIARTPKTKGKYRDRDAALRQEMAGVLVADNYERENAERLAGWNPYDQNRRADFFNVLWMFGLEEGFDIVIGNPPYVRQEAIRAQKPLLKATYPDVYTGTADLYVYFFRRGINLLREGGVLCYISSNKFMRAGYGKKLRAFLANLTDVHTLIDFGDLPVFEATAYPVIVLTQRAKPADDAKVRVLPVKTIEQMRELDEIVSREAWFSPQNSLRNQSWSLLRPWKRLLLKRLRQNNVTLGDYIYGQSYRGVVSGYDKAFVITDEQRESLIRQDDKSRDVIRPWLRGRDVQRWAVYNPDLHLIYVPWDLAIENYPAIYEHLKSHKARLEARAEVKQGRFPWYAMSRYASKYAHKFSQRKILYLKFQVEPKFSFDTQGSMLNSAIWMLTVDDLTLLAILNSAVGWFLIQNHCTPIQNGYQLIFEQFRHIPIAEPTNAQREKIEPIVQKLLDARGQGQQAEEWEQELNKLVYELYRLTEDEIALVEQAVAG